MNRPFWSRRIEIDSCKSIEPLLSLYADRMASPEEMRRVDAHLPGCERCREALAWMQATRRALAARPIALPPADLHSRIAQAIASSSAAPPLTPGVLRPARLFTLRPAYAAAASLVVVGVALSASYTLRHAENVSVKSTPSVHIASALHGIKPHSAAVPLHSVLTPPRVASTAPEDKPARSAVTPRKTAPTSAAPQEQVATTAAVSAPHLVSSRLQALGHLPVVPHAQMASVKVAPLKMHQPAAVNVIPAPKPVIMPKAPNAPLVASRDKEPISVPVEIQRPVITVQEPPVRTASVQSRPKLDNPVAALVSCAEAMQSVPYGRNAFTSRKASEGFAGNAMHALDSEHSGYQPAVYTP